MNKVATKKHQLARSVFTGVAAVLLFSAVTQPALGQPHYGLRDEPIYKFKRNPKVKILGVQIDRMVEAPPSTWVEYSLATEGASAGIPNQALVRVVYKLNVDPTKNHEGDLLAMIDTKGMRFHDGASWGTVQGPFTVWATPDNRNCFSKFIFLPNDGTSDVGKTLNLVFTFPRSKQKLKRKAVLGQGTVLGGQADEQKRVFDIGCDVYTPGSTYLPGVNNAPHISPRSRIGSKKKKPKTIRSRPR